MNHCVLGSAFVVAFCLQLACLWIEGCLLQCLSTLCVLPWLLAGYGRSDGVHTYQSILPLQQWCGVLLRCSALGDSSGMRPDTCAAARLCYVHSQCVHVRDMIGEAGNRVVQHAGQHCSTAHVLLCAAHFMEVAWPETVSAFMSCCRGWQACASVLVHCLPPLVLRVVVSR
jgi:hypothetical protein